MFIAYLRPRLLSDQNNIPGGVMKWNVRYEETPARQSLQPVQEWGSNE
jgi:hypothetical protein